MTLSAATTVAGLTDVGQVRRVNEDALLIDRDVQLYAIADGMGGHGSGDVASKLAIETLQSCIASETVHEALVNKDISDDQARGLIYQCIVGVNERIFKENLNNGHPDGTGMGTTLVGLCVFGGGVEYAAPNKDHTHRAMSFNIGDSRLYEYREATLTQLSTDHTMYRDWEEGGRIGPAPPRNIIMRAIGLLPDVDIDMDVIAIRQDATYLLCSDGLSGMLSDEQIADILGRSDDADALSKALVESANEHGGTDNISVVVITPSRNNS